MANLVVSYNQKFKAFPDDSLSDVLFCIPNIEEYSNAQKHEIFDTIFDAVDGIIGRMYEFAGETFEFNKSINLLNDTNTEKNPYLPQISYDKMLDAEIIKQNMLRKCFDKEPILVLQGLNDDKYHWQRGMDAISQVLEKKIAGNFKKYVEKNFASSDIDYPVFKLEKYNLNHARFKEGILRI